MKGIETKGNCLITMAEKSRMKKWYFFQKFDDSWAALLEEKKDMCALFDGEYKWFLVFYANKSTPNNCCTDSRWAKLPTVW